MKVRYLSVAEVELYEAYAYYEKQELDIGGDKEMPDEGVSLRCDLPVSKRRNFNRGDSSFT